MSVERIELDIELIEPMEDMRLEHDAVEDQEFLEEIRQHGIRDPIDVRQIDYNKYQVVDGRRRLRAAKILGYTKIWANLSEMDDATAYSLAFSKNHHRKSISKIEEALWLKRMQEKLTLSDEGIAKRISKNRQWVNRQILFAEDFLKAPEEEQKIMQTERQARALRLLSEEEKKALLEQASLTGEIPSGRELARKLEAKKTPQEVLDANKYNDDEFLIYLLQEEAGQTLLEARDTVVKFRAKQLSWQKTSTELPKGDYVPPPDDPTVKLYAELGKWYPLEFIDWIAKYKPAKTVSTWQDSAKYVMRKLIDKSPTDLKQSVMEEFTK